jgi:hypothetical protein
MNIDKKIKYENRTNFSIGGRDGPASGGAPGPGDTGGEGGYGRDTNQRGNIGSSPTSTGSGGDNQFTGLTKDVLNPNVDYVGDTVFGPTQKYSGDGIFSGYRNIDPVTGQPLMGLAYAGDILSNIMSPSNILGGILGLINPLAGLAFRGVNYLGQQIPETFDQFKSSNTLEEFRDKVRGYGRTMPTVSPNPMYGGIESLGVQTVAPVETITPVNKPDVQPGESYTFDELAINPGFISPYQP